jgi:hypothetical protein
MRCQVLFLFAKPYCKRLHFFDPVVEKVFVALAEAVMGIVGLAVALAAASAKKQIFALTALVWQIKSFGKEFLHTFAVFHTRKGGFVYVAELPLVKGVKIAGEDASVRLAQKAYSTAACHAALLRRKTREGVKIIIEPPFPYGGWRKLCFFVHIEHVNKRPAVCLCRK